MWTPRTDTQGSTGQNHVLPQETACLIFTLLTHESTTEVAAKHLQPYILHTDISSRGTMLIPVYSSDSNEKERTVPEAVKPERQVAVAG